MNHPSEMFEVGAEVDVKVLKFDSESERVSLGLKQITEDPWLVIAETHAIGQRVSGKVVSLTDYGAFIEIADGVEGLIHVSEMSWTKRVKHPSRLLEEGEHVEAVILDIDTENKRISLGLKQTEENPWVALEERYPIGSTVRGKVRNLTTYGAFVELDVVTTPRINTSITLMIKPTCIPMDFPEAMTCPLSNDWVTRLDAGQR